MIIMRGARGSPIVLRFSSRERIEGRVGGVGLQGVIVRESINVTIVM
jgi:hypothetical protein